MKKIIYLLASFTALLATSCDNPADDSIKVGSYNLWRSDLGKNEYAWEHRKVQLARSIADVGFDIFGIQEADLRIQEELPPSQANTLTNTHGGSSVPTRRTGTETRPRASSTIPQDSA